MNYIDWNELIGEYFFNEAMAGREVLLYVNMDTINRLGKDKGADINDFLESIKEGPSWTSGSGICQKALQAHDFWKKNRHGVKGYPPFLAYLALFVLAATIEDLSLSPSAYYKRLRKLMKEPEKSGMYPSFHMMDNLWTQLEIWSKVDKHEKLGRFTKRIRGGHVHVGLPLSQILLSENERKNLGFIFWDAELDPTNIPTEKAIKRAILTNGHGKLLKRTLDILRNEKNDSRVLADALINLVIEELAEWDGSFPLEVSEPDSIAKTPSMQAYAALKICIEIDDVAGMAKSWLRFKTNHPFPEEDIEFEHEKKIYLCKYYRNGWSGKLQGLDASTLDWSKDAQFQDKERGWKAKLKSAEVRIFLPGSYEEFSGWIESDHLERNCNFLLACHLSRAHIVQSWGNSKCKTFKNKMVQGIPHEWLLFEGSDARESCQEIEELTLSENLFLHLQGGIRIGRTNDYLSFKPPHILLAGECGNERITINGKEVFRENTRNPFWRIPKDAKVDEPLNIEVFRGDDGPIISPKTIYLVDPKLSDDLWQAPKRDRFGSVLQDNNSPYARGAIVEGVTPETWGSFPQILPTHLSKRIVFLGSKPGEIVDWPKEILPDTWSPVWSIYKIRRDKWRVHFCGNRSIADGSCNPQSPLKDKKSVQRWIYAIRKRNTLDEESQLKIVRLLWAKYKDVAKHA